MRTIHHIETAEELLHAFSSVREEGDNFLSLTFQSNTLQLSLSDFSLKLIGNGTNNIVLDFNTTDVTDLITLAFEKCGIDLQIVK